MPYQKRKSHRQDPWLLFRCLEASVSIITAILAANGFLAISQIPSVLKPAAVMD